MQLRLKHIIALLLLITVNVVLAKRYDNGTEIIIDQYQGPLDAGDTDQFLMRIGLTVGNGGGTPSCQGMDFAITGSAELTNLKLYYTDQNANFVSPILLDSRPATATVNFTGFNQDNLNNGVYYYWVLADVQPGMTPGIQVDCEYLGGTYVTGPNVFPTTPNPPGFKMTGRNYRIGTGEDYTNVSAAASALQEFQYDHDYDIFMELTSNYANPTNEAFSFPSSYQGPAKITFRPATGETGKVTELDPGTGNDLVNFTGCSNIILDGRPGGTGSNREWTLRNTRTTATVAGVVKFSNDATYNELNYLIIEGEPEDGFALVTFLSASSTGNSNNTISNCLLQDLSVGGTSALPNAGIASNGTAGFTNDNNTVDACEIVDTYRAGTSTTSGGINVIDNSSGWTITNNHFYQTTSFSSLNNNYAAITVASGGNYQISGNYIGGTAINCGGTAFTVSSGTGAFHGISINTSTGQNIINNNTFSNVHYTTTANTAIHPLVGINIEGSSSHIVGTMGNGNLIGSPTNVDNIVLTNNAVSGSYGFVGIRFNSSGTCSIIDNLIGGITVDGTKNTASSYLISSHTAAGNVTIENNVIGNTTANNIKILSNSLLNGINIANASIDVCNNNVFQNWDIDATGASCMGIQKSNGTLTANSNYFNNLDILNSYRGISVGGSTILNASNNSFENITISGTGAGTFSAFYITSTANVNLSYNTIGGSAANNMSIASNALQRPITNQGGGTAVIEYNTIQNFTLTNSGASVEFRGISCTGATSVLQATENTISNITSQATGGYLAGVYVYTNPGINHTVHGNTISGLYQDNATTSSAGCEGIYLDQGDGEISANFVSGLECKGLSSPGINGITLTEGDLDVINNVIILDNGGNTNDVLLFGIGEGSTQQLDLYHNTVILSGTGSGTSYSAGLERSGTGTLNLKNNVFQNARSGGSGGHYNLFAGAGWSANNDYNYLEVTENQSNMCYSAGAVDFSTWQSTFGATNSLNGTETFDATGYPSSGFVGQLAGTDLFTSGTVVEDFDGITRSTTPWMGAYEGTVKDKDSQLNVGAGAEPTTISSLIDADGEELMVLDFDLQDLGTADGLSTYIESLTIFESADDAILDWTDIIAGAKLYGPDLATGYAGTVTANSIVFSGTPLIEVADGTTETYELRIYLNTDLSAAKDNDLLGFQLSFDDIDCPPEYSSFGGGFVETGVGKVAIDIVATSLIFVTNEPPATAYIGQDFISSVQAVDVNGNLDLDATDLVELQLNTGGGVFSVPLGQVSLVNGEYTWQGNYDTPENIDLIVVCGTLGNTISGVINVQNASVFTVGDGQTYTTIQAAYDAIGSPLTDNYIIELYSDYDSNNETFPITFNSKTMSGFEIIVRPALGVTSVVCEGNPAGDLWQFDGCKNITIDGRPGGLGGEIDDGVFTIRHQGSWGVLDIYNDAQNNSFRYLTIESESISGDYLVEIGSSLGGGGNDNLLFDHCYIQDISFGGTSAFPEYGIYSNGSVGNENSNITITDCQFVDISNSTAGTSVIWMTNSTSWTILNNHLYHNPSTVLNNMNFNFYSFVVINDGFGYLIDGNYIGGTAPYCKGGPFMATGSSTTGGGIRGFQFQGSSAGAINYITNNVISNFNLSFQRNTVDGSSIFTAIRTFGSGDFVIGGVGNGNLIGSFTEANNITVDINNASATGGIIPIFDSSTGNSEISYNAIGGITFSSSVNTGAINYMIQTWTDAGNKTIVNNTIGGSVANSIYINDDIKLKAIENRDPNGATISSNTIQNITFANVGAETSAIISNVDGFVSVTDNTIKDITISNDAVHYIFDNGSTDGISINNNTITNINHQATTGAFRMIENLGGNISVTNNTISNVSTSADADNRIVSHIATSGSFLMDNNTLENISFTGTGASNIASLVYLNTTVTSTVSNNTLGGTSPKNISFAGANDLSGIKNVGSGNLTASNNTIQEFEATNTDPAVELIGIRAESAASLTASNNTIKNLFNNTIADNTKLNLCGIGYASSSGGTMSFSGNTIDGLYITNNSASNQALMIGIRSGSSAVGSVVEKNFITRLVSNTEASSTYGIQAYSSLTGFNAHVYNNVILLSNGGLTIGNTIYGIGCTYSDGSANVMHNTVKIFGNATGTAKLSYALTSGGAGTKIIQNNIFQNVRTGTGKHYASHFTDNTAVTIDYNYQEVDASQSANLGRWNNTDQNFANWQTASGATNDVTGSEVIDADGYADGTNTAGAGTNLSATVPDDKNGTTRNTTPTLGAYETNGPPLCGNYTIGGASPDYTTINGAVADLAANGTSCPVVFNIRNGMYNEQLQINAVPSHLVTFQSENLDSSLVTITYASNITDNYTLQINGNGQYVFNQLTLEATDNTYGHVVDINNYSFNTTITNCELKGINTTVTGTERAVVFSPATSDDQINIFNSVISGGTYGVYAEASSSGGINIDGNDIKDFYECGIYSTSNYASQITDNYIYTTSTFPGIVKLINLISDGDDYRILSNQMESTSSTAIGVQVNFAISNSTDYGLIGNNMISCPDIGIDINGADWTKLFHNSIDVQGGSAKGIYVHNGATNIFSKNNISYASGGGYALYLDADASAGLTSDYNNYHTNGGTNAAHWEGTDAANASALNAISGQDANSVSVDPEFFSTTDLHVLCTSPSGTGTDLTADLPTDIDGESRPTTPLKGADEYVSPGTLAGIYTIGGATPDYNTITEAVNDLTCRGISAAVTFDIRDGSYNEQISIPSISGSSAVNTVTFQSENADSSLVTITFAANATDNYTWDLNGASYINLNQLTLVATDATYGTVAQIRGSGTNISITNCELQGVTVTSNTTDHSIIYSPNTREDNIYIANNLLKDGSMGIYLESTTSNRETGTYIYHNNIFDSYSRSVYLLHHDAAIIEANDIESTSNYVIYYGIHLSNVDNAFLVNANRVVNTTSAGGRGIYLGSCLATFSNNGLVSNNMVIQYGNSCIELSNSDYVNIYHNSANSTWTTDAKQVVKVAAGSNNYIYNNSFTALNGAMIYDLERASLVDVDYNNIYTTGVSYGLVDEAGCTETASGFGFDTDPAIVTFPLACNNGGTISSIEITTAYIEGCGVNSDLDLYVDGSPDATGLCATYPYTYFAPVFSSFELYSTDLDATTDAVSPSGDISITYNPASPFGSFADWQTETGFDGNSVNVDPLYADNTTDLHLTSSSPSQMQNGTNITVTVGGDIDNETRSTPHWIGCDKYQPNILYWYQDGAAFNNPAKWYYDAAGTSPCSCLPDPQTDVIFNSSSFTGSGQVVTFPAGTYQIKSIDFQAPTLVPIFTGSGILEVGP